ncbi:hypothetical protein MOX02_03010 [Methylobacterium oxalidis]|uniref:Alpha-glutamyl/putrescinyl thymine pyrophosphorylase clade 3 domain-containing protein n=2 Tax=Methylobacterium oxalidis TaxID=944322 RepID=A0A512IX82_9HYPH|nr:hypothetical protein MOX02_03010 [Methylobacterium oxalidis]GJE32253.1 hypothetical protein LDDCCGHA_2439 [Methylobacterium oxalidis]GLS62208.1 hypothetical protein GCM10007888_05890 [Methylobacterium oxalidis]
MVASLRRLDYTQHLRKRHISPDRADPSSPLFDPERGSMYLASQGQFDEAFWLLFLSAHFGKHRKHGWLRVKEVYSGLGSGQWTWARISKDPGSFRIWLTAHAHKIGGGFSNHRKYESLRADSKKGTASVIESYVEWVGPHRSHAKMVRDLVQAGGNDPHSIFDHFYRSMKVLRFGRLGKFDFLALVGRLDLAPIEPGSAYLIGATGPLKGARLLFGGTPDANISEKVLEERLRALDAKLKVGMQVMEDSLCNWQKSPKKFIHFLG